LVELGAGEAGDARDGAVFERGAGAAHALLGLAVGVKFGFGFHGLIS
jgi:hypothetical protein